MTKYKWMKSFISEFRKGTIQKNQTSVEYELWLRNEAQSHFDQLENPLDSDPIEEAREMIYAISVSG